MKRNDEAKAATRAVLRLMRVQLIHEMRVHGEFLSSKQHDRVLELLALMEAMQREFAR